MINGGTNSHVGDQQPRVQRSGDSKKDWYGDLNKEKLQFKPSVIWPFKSIIWWAGRDGVQEADSNSW